MNLIAPFTSYIPQASLNREVNVGIEVLTKELLRTAPEYFNFYSRRGRAALVIAHTIAGGEITGVLPSVPNNVSLLYDYMGGSDNMMRGWAQFYTYYWNPTSSNPNTRMTYDPITYNRRVGRILYGQQPKPTGKGYFNIDKFAELLESGYFSTYEDVRQYLAQSFSLRDWQGLHEPGGGAERIRQNRIIEQSLNIVFHRDPVLLARFPSPSRSVAILNQGKANAPRENTVSAQVSELLDSLAPVEVPKRRDRSSGMSQNFAPSRRDRMNRSDILLRAEQLLEFFGSAEYLSEDRSIPPFISKRLPRVTATDSKPTEQAIPVSVAPPQSFVSRSTSTLPPAPATTLTTEAGGSHLLKTSSASSGFATGGNMAGKLPTEAVTKTLSPLSSSFADPPIGDPATQAPQPGDANTSDMKPVLVAHEEPASLPPTPPIQDTEAATLSPLSSSLAHPPVGDPAMQAPQLGDANTSGMEPVLVAHEEPASVRPIPPTQHYSSYGLFQKITRGSQTQFVYRGMISIQDGNIVAFKPTLYPLTKERILSLSNIEFATYYIKKGNARPVPLSAQVQNDNADNAIQENISAPIDQPIRGHHDHARLETNRSQFLMLSSP